MTPIRYIITLCASLLFISGCTSDLEKNNPIQQAMQTVDADPGNALTLLSNISDPESLNQDNYMHYVVTLTQARYMDYQDITGDSLILDAQRYFADKPNAAMTARASYYAGIYWYEKGVYEKVLEYAQISNYASQQANDDLFLAKSTYLIGSSYFELEQWEHAITYHSQALELYSSRLDSEAYCMELIFTLGRSYFRLEKVDEALDYFNQALEAAYKLGDKTYELLSLNALGVVYTRKKEYNQAKDYLNQALAEQENTEDIYRIYLNFARLYKATNQPDSVQYYLERVKNYVSEISYIYTRRAAYQDLAHYYEEQGSVQEMKHFTQLARKEERIIHDMQSEEKIRQAHQSLEQHKQEAEKKYSKTVLYAIIGGIGFFFILVVFRFNYLDYKEKFRQACSSQIAQKIDHQHFLLLGTRLITKGIDNLFHKSKNLNDSLIRKQFLVLRASFQVEMANQIHSAIRQLRNGAKAVMQLTTEDLCIIYLARLNYTDREISRMLGYEDLPENHITVRKRQIRDILLGAGLANRDIEILLPA